MTRIASFAVVVALFAAVGCDVQRDDGVRDLAGTHDTTKSDQTNGSNHSATQTLAACDWLGADQSCGDGGIQFCAWLYNADTGEVSTYWGDCLQAPECTLWSCRDSDEALCDLVDGKPQWVPGSCSW